MKKKVVVNNKKGLTMPNFLIGTILFSAVVAMFTIMIADVSTNYPNNYDIINENISNNYDQITEQLSVISTIRETALSEEGLSFRGAFDITFGSFFTVIRLVFASLTLMGTISVNFVIDFVFLPSSPTQIFFSVGIAIITIILLFKLLNTTGRGQI